MSGAVQRYNDFLERLEELPGDLEFYGKTGNLPEELTAVFDWKVRSIKGHNNVAELFYRTSGFLKDNCYNRYDDIKENAIYEFLKDSLPVLLIDGALETLNRHRELERVSIAELGYSLLSPLKPEELIYAMILGKAVAANCERCRTQLDDYQKEKLAQGTYHYLYANNVVFGGRPLQVFRTGWKPRRYDHQGIETL
jgi:hypothetical protein